MLDCLLMMDNNLTIKQAEDRIYTVYAWLTQVSHGHGCTITNNTIQWNASSMNMPCDPDS